MIYAIRFLPVFFSKSFVIAGLTFRCLTYNLDYCTQKGSHSHMKENSEALQTSKS